ncbi:MAG: GerMN domain-containing protein [Acidimicrobiia bacterium]
MVTGRSRLFVASGAMAALGLLINACGTTSESSTTASTIADPPASTSPSTQATTTSTELPDGVTVHLAFSAGDGSDCSEVVAVPRLVAANADPMKAAFDLLVAGPTVDEVADGASSFFSEATAGSVRSATLDGDLLTVDFEDIRNDLNNASTTCGSEALLAQLTGTAFQFVEVERVTYTIDGSCDAFFNWIQRGCEVFGRE